MLQGLKIRRWRQDTERRDAVEDPLAGHASERSMVFLTRVDHTVGREGLLAARAVIRQDRHEKAVPRPQDLTTSLSKR